MAPKNKDMPTLCGDGLPSWSFLVSCSTPSLVLASPSRSMLLVSDSNLGKVKENESDLTLVINKRNVKMKREKIVCVARSFVLEFAIVVIVVNDALNKGLIYLYIGFCVLNFLKDSLNWPGHLSLAF